MEAAFNGQHSAFSENQPQNPLAAKDAENAKESKRNQHQSLFTTEGTEAGKTTPEQQAEALLRRIGEACDELERLAEENPELVGRVTHGAEEHKEAYLRLKARLALAEAAPRCRWVRQDGTTCGSPQMKRHFYCFAHKQLAEAQALALRLPALGYRTPEEFEQAQNQEQSLKVATVTLTFGKASTLPGSGTGTQTPSPSPNPNPLLENVEDAL